MTDKNKAETHNMPLLNFPQGTIIIRIPVTADNIIPPPFDLRSIPRETGTGGRIRDLIITKK